MLEVFKSMQKAWEKPDEITYSSLITACAKGGETEEALDVFKSMQTAGVGNQGFGNDWLLYESGADRKREDFRPLWPGEFPPRSPSYLPSYLHCT